jgi:hypothetical protein
MAEKSRHTIKVDQETAQRLRLIAAIMGEKQYAVCLCGSWNTSGAGCRVIWSSR